EAEAPPNDARLDRRERVEQPADLLRPVLVGEAVEGRERVLLLEEVDEAPPVLVADRAIEREGGLGIEVLHLLELLAGDARLALELLDRGLAADAGDDGLRRARHAVVRVQHVDRDADRAALVGEGA